MHKTPTKDQNKKIKEFINLALEFNQTHNIFVRKNYTEVYQKDVLDCAPLFNMIKARESVMDLGSGGGFPGVLLSICLPNNPINLLEGSSKKCYFLKIVIEKLSLKNTKIINQTIEENNNLGVYDVITARAFASTQQIIKLTKNNTHQKTRHILLKGKKKIIQEELKLINKNKHIYEIINKDTKEHERNIVIIKNNE
tara:strand:+ start:4178 stop:4768 length:591 start_codon:yes stop_codon:yes gene_type:complete